MRRRWFRRLVFAGLLSLSLGVGGGTLWLWHMQQAGVGGAAMLETLEDFGTVPDFTLMERNEHLVRRHDLRGLVWVVNFFYTSCADTCPLQSARMARIHNDFAHAQEVRFVSISVDPEHDTPAVLRDYAQRFGADQQRWLFLTGDKGVIWRLAQEGFHLSVVAPGVTAPPPLRQQRSEGWNAFPDHGQSPRYVEFFSRLSRLLPVKMQLATAWAHDRAEPMVLHSPRFVLVDRQARIRGYYQSEDTTDLRRLSHDIQTVLQELRQS